MVSSEFELKAVNDISNSIRKLSDKIERYGGIETPDIESIREAVRIAIREKQSMSSKLHDAVKVYEREALPFGKSWGKMG